LNTTQDKAHAPIAQPFPSDWRGHLRNVYSQFGEDGLLAEIFRRIGTTNKWCFEVGAADGKWMSNTRALVDDGWEAALIESDEARFAELERFARSKYGAVRAVKATATPDNFETLLQEIGRCPDAPDLGVIDVDGQEYYLWLSLMRVRPRVMVVEFDPNAMPNFIPERGGKGQAGLGAICSVAGAKGYLPVGRTETNAIFIVHEEAHKVFGDDPPIKIVEQPKARSALRLNIGGGLTRLPGDGWVSVDRIYGGEAYPLSVPDPCGNFTPAENSVDEIYAAHVLEHFGRRKGELAIRQWVSVLKPGGRLRIAVPDMDKIVEAINAGNPDNHPLQAILYGGQTETCLKCQKSIETPALDLTCPDCGSPLEELDYHKAGFNEEWLRFLLNRYGLTDIKRWEPEIDDCAKHPLSLNLGGTKPHHPAAQQLDLAPSAQGVYAVMSLPRYGATRVFNAIYQALVPLGIPLEMQWGAWWEHGLTRGVEAALKSGAEFVLTMDYDTPPTKQVIESLIALMKKHPEAAAIAPMQVKREQDVVLFRPINPDGTYKTENVKLTDFDGDLTEVGWSHFGCTIFRCDAIRKMKKPWFLATPDKDGGWSDHSTHADIHFWLNLRESGGRVFIANHVSVPHIQEVAVHPKHELDGVMYQYLADWCAKGNPPEARK